MALYYDQKLDTPAEYITIHTAWQRVSNIFAVCSGSPSGGSGHVSIYTADVSIQILHLKEFRIIITYSVF